MPLRASRNCRVATSRVKTTRKEQTPRSRLRSPAGVQIGGSLAASSLNTACDTESVGASNWSTVFNEIKSCSAGLKRAIPIPTLFDRFKHQPLRLAAQAVDAAGTSIGNPWGGRVGDLHCARAWPEVCTNRVGGYLPQRCLMHPDYSVSRNLSV